MRIFQLAALLACLGSQALAQQPASGPARRDECFGGAASSMSSATVAYQVQLANLRSSSRNTVPANASKGELELIFRRHEAIIRELREKRTTLLALYRHMLSSECPGYSAAGLQSTIAEFNRFATGEQTFLAALRSSAGIWSPAGFQDVPAFQ